MIRPHAHPWPGTPAGPGALRHIFRRCPPGCAHASGLLLTPPRAMRCEPALRGSMIASSRQTGAMPTSSAPWPWRWPPHVTHHHGHVASPTQAHEFPARPAGSARHRFAHIFTAIHRHSAPLRYCAAVQHRSCSFPCFTLLPHALVQRRSCSRRFAALRTSPPGRSGCPATPVGGPVPSILVRTFFRKNTINNGTLLRDHNPFPESAAAVTSKPPRCISPASPGCDGRVARQAGERLPVILAIFTAFRAGQASRRARTVVVRCIRSRCNVLQSSKEKE